MTDSNQRPKIVAFFILLVLIVMLTINLNNLEWWQDERDVWHLDTLGGSIIYLSGSQGEPVIWIYWGQYFIGRWTVWADSIPQNPPPPTNTSYPTATPYPTSPPPGQLSAALTKNR